MTKSITVSYQENTWRLQISIDDVITYSKESTSQQYMQRILQRLDTPPGRIPWLHIAQSGKEWTKGIKPAAKEPRIDPMDEFREYL